MPEFTCNVQIDDKQLERLLNKAVAQEVQQFFRKVKPQIEDGSRQYIAEAIQASPEWQSLLQNGSGERISLREHFGIVNPAPVLSKIVKSVQDGVKVEPLPPSGNILGGFIVRILPMDYAAELQVEGAKYTSTNAKGVSYDIPWLKWLLVGGAGILVVESQIIADRERAGSRTGRAVMVTPTKKPSQGWRVPTEFAGTAENNWLTRALADNNVGSRICDLFRTLMIA